MSPRFLIAAASVAAVFVANSAVAQNILVSAPAPTFRNLEFDGHGADRVELARTSFARSIPIGSSATSARALLKQAGAHCNERRLGRLTCEANSFEGVDDFLHDVNWTVQVDHEGDAVTGLSVDRTSIGS